MPIVITSEGALTHTPLTSRERDILHLWSRGMQQKEIADHLKISLETVKKHLKNIYRKLNAHNKIEALRKAGLI